MAQIEKHQIQSFTKATRKASTRDGETGMPDSWSSKKKSSAAHRTDLFSKIDVNVATFILYGLYVMLNVDPKGVPCSSHLPQCPGEPNAKHI